MSGEWLELGKRPSARAGPNRRFVIGGVVVLIMVLIAGAVILSWPSWLASEKRLDRNRVSTALLSLDLTDPQRRWTIVGLGFTEPGGACAVLRGPESFDRAAGIPAVMVTGGIPNDRATATITTLILETPGAAGETFGQVAATLEDEKCLGYQHIGLIGVDPPPLPERQLAYRIAFSSGETWWYRVRMLRYGNTISYLTSFGPTGSADVTTPLVEALDRALARA